MRECSFEPWGEGKRPGEAHKEKIPLKNMHTHGWKTHISIVGRRQNQCQFLLEVKAIKFGLALTSQDHLFSNMEFKYYLQILGGELVRKIMGSNCGKSLKVRFLLLYYYKLPVKKVFFQYFNLQISPIQIKVFF